VSLPPAPVATGPDVVDGPVVDGPVVDAPVDAPLGPGPPVSLSLMPHPNPNQDPATMIIDAERTMLLDFIALPF
jgi:hypothetical protein